MISKLGQNLQKIELLGLFILWFTGCLPGFSGPFHCKSNKDCQFRAGLVCGPGHVCTRLSMVDAKQADTLIGTEVDTKADTGTDTVTDTDSATETVDARHEINTPDNDTNTNTDASCTPKTCAYLGMKCGTAEDGCGKTLNCGSCATGQFCFEGKCHPKTFIVPPTNQTQCYDDSGPIECPDTAGSATCKTHAFCGQDAQYPDNLRTFTVENHSSQDVVMDSLTGIMWERIFVQDKKWQDAVSYCANLNYAGYGDWKLPSVHDLAGIVDYGRSKPAVDTSAFPGTPSGYFWASGGNKDGWYVSFVNGESSYTDLTASVRCMRSKSFPTGGDRFITREYEPGEDIVMDMATGLMWQDGYTIGKDWQHALAYCESLNYGGFSDWRLPNINELRSLVNYDKTKPATDFPKTIPVASHFWSSTTVSAKPGSAWTVAFFYGEITTNVDKGTTAYTMCVRMGP